MTRQMQRAGVRARIIVSVTLGILLGAASAFAGPVFLGLGDLPGGGFLSRANAVSDDGTTVVAMSTSTSCDEAFRWTPDTGMVSMYDSPGRVFNDAAAGVLAGGPVLVGYGSNPLAEAEAWAGVIPESLTLSLLAIGIFAMARTRRLGSRAHLVLLFAVCLSIVSGTGEVHAQWSWTRGPVLIGGDDMDHHQFVGICSQDSSIQCSNETECWFCIDGDDEGEQCASDSECAGGGTCDMSNLCTWSGPAGLAYIREGFNFLGQHICDVDRTLVVCIGCNEVSLIPSVPSLALEAFTMGFDASDLSGVWTTAVLTDTVDIDNFFRNDPAAPVKIRDTGIIYMPTSAQSARYDPINPPGQTWGGITRDQLTRVIQNVYSLVDFVDSGGGLFTHTLWGLSEGGYPNYAWFTTLFPDMLAADEPITAFGGVAELFLTCDGKGFFLSPGLTEAEAHYIDDEGDEAGGAPWHTHFLPRASGDFFRPRGWSGLTPIAMGVRPTGEEQVVILAAPRPSFSRSPDCDRNSVPDLCEAFASKVCCYPAAGTCTVDTQCGCEATGGIFSGAHTSCTWICQLTPFVSCNSSEECGPDGPCVPPPGFPCHMGACCDTNGTCTEVSGGLCDGDPGEQCINDADCTAPATCELACGAESVAQGFGSSCDQDCCEQPQDKWRNPAEEGPWSGGDNCNEAYVHQINVPPLGQAPVTVTITGDNSNALGQDGCGELDPDPVWWEAFQIPAGECADVRIDLCCTDPPHVPAYGHLYTGCPCDARIENGIIDVQPFGIPPLQASTGFGQPLCGDLNFWATFRSLPGGTYYYPIYSDPDGHLGQYQLHITVVACRQAACCLPTGICVQPGSHNEGDPCNDNSDCCYDWDQGACEDPIPGRCDPNCSDINEFDCETAGGYWLVTDDCTDEPCIIGSCCNEPGQCCDPQIPTSCVDRQTCDSQGGTYVGGATCEHSTKPCPVCQLTGDSFCQAEADYFVLLSNDTTGAAWADDFIPDGTTISTINQICVAGAYVKSNGSDCADEVNGDYFEVRIYQDDGGLPGAIVGMSEIDPSTNLVKVRDLYNDPLGATVGFWEFQLTLDTAITGLMPGNSYWIEIVNDPTPTPDSCDWYWAVSKSGGNDYSVGKDTGSYGLANVTPYDLHFCLDISAHTDLSYGSAGTPSYVRFVDTASPAGDDGLTWATAFDNLQDALRAAKDARNRITEIRVAAGTYRPDQGIDVMLNDRSATFQLLSGVAVSGGFLGNAAGGGETACFQRYPAANVTILSGNIGVAFSAFDNSYHVVTASGTDSSAVLDGFTVMDGYANGADPDGNGAGIYMENGSPTVRNCDITVHTAWDTDGTGGFGGGAYVAAGAPTFTDCTFSANVAKNAGGAVYTSQSGSVSFAGCAFTNNQCDLNGGAVACTGSTPEFANCTFIANQADFDGGAVHDSACSSTFVNCVFAENSAARAGAIYTQSGSDLKLANCTFSGNEATQPPEEWHAAGAIFIEGLTSTVLVTSSTFSVNTANGIGGGIALNHGDLTVRNSIFWGNTEYGITGESAQIRISTAPSATHEVQHTCIDGLDPGGRFDDDENNIMNIGADPQFVDVDGLDDVPGTQDDVLRLYASSSGIDRGNSDIRPPDWLDIDGNGNTTELLPLDLAGNARVHNATGLLPVRVDMGAYEFACVAVETPTTPTTPPVTGEDGFAKNRYISFVPHNAGLQAAMRVTLTQSTLFPTCDVGMEWWVGPPTEYCERSNEGDPPPGGCGFAGGGPLTFMGARLQCDPYFTDWDASVGSGATLHVYGPEVVPGATYEVQAIDTSCNLGSEGDFSAPLVITTSIWGDVCGFLVVGPPRYWDAPDGVVDVIKDVFAVLEKFSNLGGAPINARSDVANRSGPLDPLVDQKVHVSPDLDRVLEAFQGYPYPFDCPAACP